MHEDISYQYTAKIMQLLPKSSKARLARSLKGLIRDRQKLKLILSFLECENIDELYYLKRSVFSPDDINSILAIGDIKSPPDISDTEQRPAADR